MDTTIVVTYNGQQFTITKLGPADLVAFERQFQQSASVFAEGAAVKFEWVCFLVWRGLRRLGAITREQAFDDEFLDLIDEIDMVDAPAGDAGNPQIGSAPPAS